MQRLQTLAAFLAVYLIWGGTYATIRVGVLFVPTATLSGGRFVLAGVVLVVWQRNPAR